MKRFRLAGRQNRGSPNDFARKYQISVFIALAADVDHPFELFDDLFRNERFKEDSEKPLLVGADQGMPRVIAESGTQKERRNAQPGIEVEHTKHQLISAHSSFRFNFTNHGIVIRVAEHFQRDQRIRRRFHDTAVFF